MGKVFSREDINRWGLPDGLTAIIDESKQEYFFLIAVRDEEKEKKSIRFSLFPISYEKVYFLEVNLETILPEILQDVLNLIRNASYDIITSTGMCATATKCHFGVFFAGGDMKAISPILIEIQKMNKVISAKSYEYSCNNCCQIK